MHATFSEADMYEPVKEFFTGMGYLVHGEVKGCDIAMRKDGALIVIELKKAFSLKLLYQAIDRLGVTSQVYVAIPRPIRTRSREASQMLKILKKLEIGLIYVNMESAVKSVEIIAFPPPVLKSGSKRRRDAVLGEMDGRSADLNRGGQTRKPLATAYREKTVKIACALEASGQLAPKELVNLHGCDKKTGVILRQNFYGWFDKTAPGLYALSAKGVAMLAGEEFSRLADIYRKNNNGIDPAEKEKA